MASCRYFLHDVGIVAFGQEKGKDWFEEFRSLVIRIVASSFEQHLDGLHWVWLFING
jgi:hypothetical protein